MKKIKLNIDGVMDFISKKEIEDMSEKVNTAKLMLQNKSGKGSEYLGWLNLPSSVSKDDLKDIEESAAKLRKISDIIVVIGIGGSYLGARAVIDSLSNNFSYLQSKKKRKGPLVLFAGNNIGEDYLYDLTQQLDDSDYSLIVISKSGTTTEPAIAFRILRNHLEDKYGKKKTKERIIVVTDKSKGALKKLAVEEGYKSYVIPDDVGGRYSVLTPVGLLPVAAAGFDIRKLIEGAVEMEEFTSKEEDIFQNSSDLYAAVRNILYKKDKLIEIVASYQPSMNYFIEWWKQLFGESEGKEETGIYPSGVNLTTDLHSMGQYMQEGMRKIMETVLFVESAKEKLKVPKESDDTDELNYISGKRINEINRAAKDGTVQAHKEGNVPVMEISIPELNERYLGQLIYFFEKACGVSGYILGINPFNQPGVEAYKKNMFKILGKPQ
ncbi:glucose-6-phosphate isomerase [soil metagenome]